MFWSWHPSENARVFSGMLDAQNVTFVGTNNLAMKENSMTLLLCFSSKMHSFASMKYTLLVLLCHLIESPRYRKTERTCMITGDRPIAQYGDSRHDLAANTDENLERQTDCHGESFRRKGLNWLWVPTARVFWWVDILSTAGFLRSTIVTENQQIWQDTNHELNHPTRFSLITYFRSQSSTYKTEICKLICFLVHRSLASPIYIPVTYY
jgi:hypothetical protein